MARPRVLSALGAVILAGAAGCGSRHLAERPPTSELEGVWRGRESGGGEWVLNIEGERFFATTADVPGAGGTLKLSPEVQPREVDLRFGDCHCPWQGKTSRAIYALRDDRLRLAAAEPGLPGRPRSFTPAEGVRLVELRRVETPQPVPAP